MTMASVPDEADVVGVGDGDGDGDGDVVAACVGARTGAADEPPCEQAATVIEKKRRASRVNALVIGRLRTELLRGGRPRPFRSTRTCSSRVMR
jgi:hypothetical protein